MNSRVPLLAMVPRLATASSADMPMPLSVMVIVFASLSNATRTSRFGLVLVQLGLVDRLEAQLVAGVRRVRDQLAQEDLLVRVQRVGDEVQDLLDLGLEGKGLLVHRRLVRFVEWAGRRLARPRPRREDGGAAAIFKPSRRS